MRMLFVASAALAIAGFSGAESRKANPVLPKVGPISYFDDHCAKCHGPQGSFYGDDFGKNLKEGALHKVVDDMCRHQGEAPLDGADLEAEVAYHRAMIAKEPFLAITKITSMQISGEVTEKSVVRVKFKRSTIWAIVNNTAWKTAIPRGEKPADAVVTAILDKRSTVLRLASSAFSHGAGEKTRSEP